MTDISNITKPDILTLKEGDEILIRVYFSHVATANLNGFVVTESNAPNESGLCIDANRYFGKIEPEISVGDKFKSTGNECTVIAIHKDNLWVEWLGGFHDTRTIGFLKTLERIPK